MKTLLPLPATTAPETVANNIDVGGNKQYGSSNIPSKPPIKLIKCEN